jgi:hypothetical protein
MLRLGVGFPWPTSKWRTGLIPEPSLLLLFCLASLLLSISSTRAVREIAGTCRRLSCLRSLTVTQSCNSCSYTATAPSGETIRSLPHRSAAMSVSKACAGFRIRMRSPGVIWLSESGFCLLVRSEASKHRRFLTGSKVTYKWLFGR